MDRFTIALAGDTMLGRGVAAQLDNGVEPESLVSDEVAGLFQQAALAILNLECCISERGTPWPDPGKPFFFRAPPAAVRLLSHLGIDAVTLANNHALDFGPDALADTLSLLASAGVAVVGAGSDLAAARLPAELPVPGGRLTLVGLTDHPSDFAAESGRPGVAYTELSGGRLPGWLVDAVDASHAAGDFVLVSAHWGPNMTEEPVPHVRLAADAILSAGAALVAGHSAHVFHGVADGVLFDLGDFLDDYAVDPRLRNDLGLVWLVTVVDGAPRRLEAVPVRLEFAHTRLADAAEAAWIERRFRAACAAFGTDVATVDGRLVVEFRH